MKDIRETLLFSHCNNNSSIIIDAGCSIPKNPKVSFGKKCVDKQDSVVYSYVWVV